MGSTNTLMGSGISGLAADAITTGTVALAVSGAGTTSADATQLTADSSLVTTTASGTGVKLPDVGGTVAVYNGGANSLKVYPHTGGQINNATATTGFQTIATLKGGTFRRLSTIHWGCTAD